MELFQRAKIFALTPKQLVWIFFFALTGFCSLFYACKAGKELYIYHRLNGFTEAKITKWGILSVKEKKFYITAYYSFVFDSKSYFGKTVFSSYSLNQLSAERALQEMNKKNFVAYFDDRNPKRSSLEKEIPMKNSLHALVCLSLFGYFFLLKNRMQNFF
jgi:hypothetical protein